MDASKYEETDTAKKTEQNEPTQNPINGMTLISISFIILLLI